MPLRWQCPEAIATRVYTAKSDVYSYGVLLYEIYSGGATPFGQLRSVEVLRAVKAGEVLARPAPDTPDDMMALMRLCTRLAVGARPSMATVYAKLTGTWLLDEVPPGGVEGNRVEPRGGAAAVGPGMAMNAIFRLGAGDAAATLAGDAAASALEQGEDPASRHHDETRI